MLHTLRPGFAIYLLENGIDLKVIQNLPCHEKSKTTEECTYLNTKGFSQIKSPLDQLNIL
ncbi:MAG TPA: hypothetical protein DCL77_20740 [Prolixibacteraceae bacterium]|nr:hypothetical protein [Prolixibacteraceae bacterium]